MHYATAYGKIVDYTATPRLRARSLFGMFAGKLPVVPVSEAIAFKALASALCHSTAIVDGAGYAVIWGILVMAPDTLGASSQRDLISFAAPLCHANGTALLTRAKRTVRPFEGLHRHPLSPAAHLAPCITRGNAQPLRR